MVFADEGLQTTCLRRSGSSNPMSRMVRRLASMVRAGSPMRWGSVVGEAVSSSPIWSTASSRKIVDNEQADRRDSVVIDEDAKLLDLGEADLSLQQQ